MKKLFLLISAGFLSLVSFNIYAEDAVSVKTFFGQNDKKSVLEGQIITAVFRDTGTGSTKTDAAVPKTIYTVEDYPAYEMVITEKAFIPYVLDDSAGIALYNNLAAYSRLTGVRYYSATDKKVETLIIRGTRVEDSLNLTAVKDRIYSRVDSGIINYFMIEDNRFGDTVFKSRIYNEGGNFIVKNVSTHALKKFGFTINRPGEYHFTFFFFYDRAARGYFYYAVQALRIRSVYFQKLGIISSDSFANRLRAMTVHYAGLMGQNWEDRLKRD